MGGHIKEALLFTPRLQQFLLLFPQCKRPCSRSCVHVYSLLSLLLPDTRQGAPFGCWRSHHWASFDLHVPRLKTSDNIKHDLTLLERQRQERLRLGLQTAPTRFYITYCLRPSNQPGPPVMFPFLPISHCGPGRAAFIIIQVTPPHPPASPCHLPQISSNHPLSSPHRFWH